MAEIAEIAEIAGKWSTFAVLSRFAHMEPGFQEKAIPYFHGMPTSLLQNRA